MKIKKFVVLIPLIILIIIIWFFNLQFINRIKMHKVEVRPETYTSLFLPESIRNTNFTFKPLKKDPFNVVIDTMPKEPEMPEFFLRGVVLTKDGALALMELSDGNVYPMKKGETYLGVKIKKITPKQVFVDFRGKGQVFTIWE